MILSSKKINFNKLDIAADENLRTKMREIMGDPKGLPPQLCNGEQYCGVSVLARLHVYRHFQGSELHVS